MISVEIQTIVGPGFKPCGEVRERMMNEKRSVADVHLLRVRQGV
jgi:hypothetical protein